MTAGSWVVMLENANLARCEETLYVTCAAQIHTAPAGPR